MALDKLVKLGIKLENERAIYAKGDISREISLPRFPIGENDWKFSEAYEKETDRGVEAEIYFVSGSVKLKMEIQAFNTSKIIRFRYSLSGQEIFSGLDGRECIEYLALKEDFTGFTSIELSHFERMTHTYNICEHHTSERVNQKFPGPILIINNSDFSVYTAYEHGATMPDHYLKYNFDGSNGFKLLSNKGNYYDGQDLSDYRAPWIQFAIAGNEEEVKRELRSFYLNCINPNKETAKPYIYYNTWGHQDIINRFYGRPYLDDMNDERILREVEAAKNMGVDVFVIDTGWYKSAGEYEVHTGRLKGGLKNIKKKLDSYGMKLGLWFDPTVASVYSRYYKNHSKLRITSGGKPINIGVMWESEECEKMCVASEYSNLAIETMLNAYNQYGVMYFKWDGIHQYLCDAPNHWHGTAQNTPKERSDCFSYRMGLELIRIVEEVSKTAKEIIVDFDMTESQRFFGMGFLAVGKYFYANNSIFPSKIYFDQDLSDPVVLHDIERRSAMRDEACRRCVQFDKLFPSTLFMAHFPPDLPEKAQRNSLASMVLGPNAVWGDIVETSEEDQKMYCDFLCKYKKVAASVTNAYPITSGSIGDSPEICEKLDHDKCEGIVVFFTHEAGVITHITDVVEPFILDSVDGADSWRMREDSRLEITVDLSSNDARVVFVFGKN